MAQTYTNPVAIERMRNGVCPECARFADDHGGWGRSGCSLTDNGVAQRIYYQGLLDEAAAAMARGHGPDCEPADEEGPGRCVCEQATIAARLQRAY